MQLSGSCDFSLLVICSTATLPKKSTAAVKENTEALFFLAYRHASHALRAMCLGRVTVLVQATAFLRPNRNILQPPAHAEVRPRRRHVHTEARHKKAAS